jgi:hypothetical protein
MRKEEIVSHERYFVIAVAVLGEILSLTEAFLGLTKTPPTSWPFVCLQKSSEGMKAGQTKS